jgi:thioesterase domain-containing protein
MQHLTPDDRHMLLISPATSASQNHIWASLLAGARVVVVDIRRHGIQEAFRVMAHRGITTYASAPFVFRRLMELCRDRRSVATVRLVNLMTDRVFASDLTLFREGFPETCLFSTNIGSSEASTYCAWFVPRDAGQDKPLIPGGYTLPDFEVTVVDDTGNPVERGEMGEIVVAGEFIAEGYWRDETLTREAFSTDPRDSKRRVNRTGDLGIMRADGLIEMVGRRDRQLKIRGLRVEPTEVEATLRGHPAVRDAAVIPRHVGDGIEIVAYASPKPETPSLQPADLSAWVGVHLPQAMRPRHLYIIDALPLLGNFKPDIRALETLDRERVARESTEAASAHEVSLLPEAAVYEAVRVRWQRLLGRASFEANLTWDEAGGDSLQALELVFALEEALGRPIGTAVLGPATRPSDLIAALQTGGVATVIRADGNWNGAIRLFFLPGYAGLVFHEARFVQALAGHLTVEVVDYPPVVPTCICEIPHAELVAHVVRSVRTRRRDGESIGLLGYSLGGYVAFDAANRLKAEGIDLSYVGLVDVSAPGRGPLAADIAPTLPVQRSPSWVDPFRKAVTVITRPRYAFDRLITVCVDNAEFGRLAMLWRVLEALRLRNAQVRFRVLTMRLVRLRACAKHSYQAYAGPISLFYGADNRGWREMDLPDDLGWSDWCTSVEVHRVVGDHVGMLQPANLEFLTRTIRSECEQTLSKKPPDSFAPV